MGRGPRLQVWLCPRQALPSLASAFSRVEMRVGFRLVAPAFPICFSVLTN